MSALEGQLVVEFVRQFPMEFAQYLEEHPLDQRIEVLQALPTPLQGVAMNRLGPESGARTIAGMPESLRKSALPAMDFGRLALVYARLPPPARDMVTQVLSPQAAGELEELAQYPPDRAGYFMDPQPIHFRVEDTVESALKRIRKQRQKRLTDLYVVDDQHVLQAKIPLLDVALADGETKLLSLKKAEPVSVKAMSSKDEVLELMESHSLSSLPVVGGDDRLLGVIRNEGLVALIQQDAMGDLQTMVGVSPEEKALSPASFAMKKRLPWLSINLLTTFVAAFVVGLFEDTIAKITALAVLLPVVAGQSGNTGMQAQAVTMRGLALREIRTRHWWQMLAKEGTVGLTNGVVIGVVCGLAVFAWSQSLGLGLVMTASMIFAMVIAGLSGAAIPLILSALRQDPAQSSSIILTTVTDVVGFLSFLGLATVFSRFLV